MFEEALAILIWTLAVAGIGCWIGLVIGQENFGRCYAEAQVEDLREQLAESRSEAKLFRGSLKNLRSVLNDTHRRVVAVSKGLPNQPR